MKIKTTVIIGLILVGAIVISGYYVYRKIKSIDIFGIIT